MSKDVTPSIRKTAFNCPHCGTQTTQHWFHVYVEQLPENALAILSERDKYDITNQPGLNPEDCVSILELYHKLDSGNIFLRTKTGGTTCYEQAYNLSLTKCCHCNKFAVWIHDRMVSPVNRTGVEPNPDLPEDVIKDFQEAREIADASPRGAAALLRLGIQKLCAHLGEEGKNINDDIGNLVRKGLNPVVQQSLDIVRVIGNEAVHPGIIDLKDDRETVFSLFTLVNLIADEMITRPKTVNAMFAKLPEDKRKAIAKRDGKQD